MNHLLLGAAIPFALGLLLYAANKFRAPLWALIVFPCLTALSAIWALVPDIPRAFRMKDLYFRMSTDPRSDIFYWHYTIDLTEEPSRWYTIGFVGIFLMLLIVAIREVKLSEKELKGP